MSRQVCVQQRIEAERERWRARISRRRNNSRDSNDNHTLARRRNRLTQTRHGIATKCNIDNFHSEEIAQLDFEECTLQCIYCQAYGYKKENKGSSTSPHFGSLCCNKNKIHLEQFPKLPDELETLFTSTTPEAKYFRKHLRKFNAGMAMASLAVNDATVNRGGPAAFKIYGLLHRRIGSMLPMENSSDEPSCLQIYFYDPEYQHDIRVLKSTSPNSQQNSKEQLSLERSIFEKLHRVLSSHNSYLQSFLTINEYIEKEQLNPEEICFELHSIKNSGTQHSGRYNLPSVPEVSILMPCDIPRDCKRSIVCSVRQPASTNSSNHLITMPDTHRSYDPLAYPLFFPHGTDGWSLSTKSLAHPFKNISISEYTRFHLMKRNGYCFLHDGHRLFQQYITDQYAKAEAQRLRWIKINQRQLRADLYRGLQDSIQNNSVENSGTMYILPASFTGSDRWYHRNYKDAMALVQKFGKPDFFITMTLNVNCPEVTKELKPGQTPYDRPDILCRVFQMRRNELIKEIVCDGIFGKCKAHVHVIEFQKRGAPHAHILIWLENFAMTPANIDNVISAEIPPPNDPLHDAVVEMMIHGPCGIFNTKLSCMENGHCKRKYPRDFSDSTVILENGYPQYRRRSPEAGGHTSAKFIRGQRVVLDNRWVVPYSPYLLRKYNCHVNIEYCNTVSSVKYLFLYHFKGVDMITTEGLDPSDEITKFVTRRYLSSCYCYWRLSEFKMLQIEPTVHQLPLHLENQQMVTYLPNRNDAQEVLKSSTHTQLTKYFEANEHYSNLDNFFQEEDRQFAIEVRTLKYEDFPTKFSWDSSKKHWKRREQNQRIGTTPIG